MFTVLRVSLIVRNTVHVDSSTRILIYVPYVNVGKKYMEV